MVNVAHIALTSCALSHIFTSNRRHLWPPPYAYQIDIPPLSPPFAISPLLHLRYFVQVCYRLIRPRI